jgi:eukaryotic-like serine/threonine-protein kinase
MTETAHPCMRCQEPLPLEVIQCPYCDFPLGNGEAPEAWMGEIIDRKYEVEEVLGVGGMGMVFRAKRAMVGDEVALKILFPHFLKSPLQRRLFQDEAVSTAQLDHPNIVTLYDADIDDQYKVAYMAMEILEGYTFKEMMLAEAPMKPKLIYPIFSQVCDGLSAAHQAQIIHRDLKPDNLFLCPSSHHEMIVKVLDFGIATVMGVSNEDESNKLLGTLRYMAPEQCKGDPCTPQTDLYAIGVILYESLTRQRATGKSVNSVLYDEVIPPNQRLSPDKAIPEDLERLVMQLLSKKPADRPKSAIEVRQRLRALQDPFGTEAAAIAHSYQATVDEKPALDPDPWAEPDRTPIIDAQLSIGNKKNRWMMIAICVITCLGSFMWSSIK